MQNYEKAYQKTQLQKVDKEKNLITILHPITEIGAITSEGKTLLELLDEKAPIESPSLTGEPLTTTPIGDNIKQITNVEYVKNEIDRKLEASEAMIFKGTLGVNGIIQTLPNNHSIGDTYKVITKGEYAGQQCEVGDTIICISDGEVANDEDWTVVQANIDGAVVGPTEAIVKNVAIFNSSTGKVIADSGFTIGCSVPEDAKFTDTTYEKATAISDGLMSKEDKEKIDNIAEGAQVNVIENIKVNNQGQSIVNKTVDIFVPTKNSQIENDSNFITKEVDNLTNYYTKTNTENKIREILIDTQTASIRKVTELPAEAEKNVIYLVPKTSSVDENTYYEYIWCEQEDGSYNWEKIGDTKIDLEGDFVSATKIQNFSDTEKELARNNIGAVSQEVIITETEPDNNIPVWINLSGDTYKKPQEKYTIIKNETDISISQALLDNYEFRFLQKLNSLIIGIPTEINDDYRCKLVFQSGDSATTFTVENGGNYNIKFIGDNCENYIFTPASNRVYNIQFWYDSININALVRGI